jgi:hypothetical protein
MFQEVNFITFLKQNFTDSAKEMGGLQAARGPYVVRPAVGCV